MEKKQLSKITITESYFTDSGTVKGFEQVINVDGNLIYQATLTQATRKYSPISNVIDWLTDHEVESGSYVCNNRSNCVDLIRYYRFKPFNFKQKLFNIFFKKLFLCSKSTSKK